MNTLLRWGAWSHRRVPRSARPGLDEAREAGAPGADARETGAREPDGARPGAARPGAPTRAGLAAQLLAAIPLPRRRPVVDPFCALEVQMALTRVEGEIAELGRWDGRFARGHHLTAARMAYDQLLVEACGLAGVEHLPEQPGLRRIVAEAELRTRGWSW